MASRDIGGVHFVFLTIWPDSGARAWMEKDLERVSDSTPVIMFAHVPPDSDAKMFRNPNGAHDINAVDKFENLLDDTFAVGSHEAASSDAEPVLQRVEWEQFL